MTLASASATHVGNVRQNNEDTHLVSPQQRLYAVADGMGGHAAGEVASALAIATLNRMWRPHYEEDLLPPHLISALHGIFETVHVGLLSNVQRHLERAGMGTTLTALYINDELTRATVAHVGDSRLYLIRDGTGTQVTQDHVESEQVLNNCLGCIPAAFQGASTYELSLQAEDVLILCTDGLSDYVSAEQAARLATLTAAKVAPKDFASYMVEVLLHCALKAGGRDNITIIVLHVRNA